jgi:hypothetical protein
MFASIDAKWRKFMSDNFVDFTSLMIEIKIFKLYDEVQYVNIAFLYNISKVYYY